VSEKIRLSQQSGIVRKEFGRNLNLRVQLKTSFFGNNETDREIHARDGIDTNAHPKDQSVRLQWNYFHFGRNQSLNWDRLDPRYQVFSQSLNSTSQYFLSGRWMHLVLKMESSQTGVRLNFIQGESKHLQATIQTHRNYQSSVRTMETVRLSLNLRQLLDLDHIWAFIPSLRCRLGFFGKMHQIKLST